MNEKPLVSIPVITYNSSSYILEGLESLKTQTYKNIEVVISDDCSTDNTVEICQEWLEANKQYFKRTVLVTTDKNTGVAGNLNRAIRECQGEWIRGLSGDDKFFPYTIEKYIEFLAQNPNCNIAFAKLFFYGESSGIVNKTKNIYEKNYYPKIQAPYKTQFRENLKQLFLPGPGLIFKKSLWSMVNGFDEKYPLCEEIPFTTRVLDLGEKVFFIDKELYKYHVRDDSLSGNKSKSYYILRSNIRSYFRNEGRKRMIQNGLFLHAIDRTITYNLDEAIDNNSSVKKLLYLSLIYFSPLRILSYLKRIIGK